jgi:titin
VLGGVSGVTYTITVTPLAADDVAGTSASITTSLAVAAPEIPSSPPADAPLDLTTDRGDITTAQPGQTVTVIGTGFLPYSTVSIVIYSTPVNLGMATTDANGAFTKTVTVPSSLAAGSHSLVAYGVDPSGNLHSLRMNVTVPPAAGSSGGSNRALAYTGLDINPLAFVVAGGGLLLAGLVLLVVSRTRRQEAGDGAELVASGEQEKAMAEVAAP